MCECAADNNHNLIFFLPLHKFNQISTEKNTPQPPKGGF